MKIYLAGSISGGRQFEKGIKAIAKLLQDEGHEILTPFVIDAGLNQERFPNLRGKERAKAIFREDLNLLVTEGNPYVKLLYYSPDCTPDLKEKLGVFLASFETLDQKIRRERSF